MNPADRYLELVSRLNPWRGIWAYSVLQRWPDSAEAYPQTWLDWAATLDAEGERDLDRGIVRADAPADLRALVNAFDQLTDLPWTTAESPLSLAEQQGLNQKKIHEVQRILTILEPLAAGIPKALDIGGGMGHLARVCVRRFGWTFHSLDRAAELQAKGVDWLSRSRGMEKDRLKFVCTEVVDRPQSEIDGYFEDALTIGLHTCGGLAVTHLKKSLRSKAILNFGCCYDKMDPSRDYPLSKVGQASPLFLTRHALFLATRGRTGKSQTEFDLMKQVYDLRFGLDCLLREDYPGQGFVQAGDAPKSLYREGFVAYARDRLKRLGLPSKRSDDELQSFFESRYSEIRRIFHCHLLRERFARPLEICVLLDRAEFLRDQGFETRIEQVFDPSLSPRNIMILTETKRDFSLKTL